MSGALCSACDWYADGIGGGCIAGRPIPSPAACSDFTPAGTFDPFKPTTEQEHGPYEPEEDAEEVERGRARR